MEGNSDTWISQIHGRYLRYMDISDTWKVPQIHGYLRYMEGTSDTWISQIHRRYLRYMEGTSDTWDVPQIHGTYLRYMEGTSDTYTSSGKCTVTGTTQPRKIPHGKRELIPAL